jgi:hypothetical protein
MQIELRSTNETFHRDRHFRITTTKRMADATAEGREFEPTYMHVQMQRRGARAARLPWAITYVTVKGPRIKADGQPGAKEGEACWTGRDMLRLASDMRSGRTSVPQPLARIVVLAEEELRIAEEDRLSLS